MIFLYSFCICFCSCDLIVQHPSFSFFTRHLCSITFLRCRLLVSVSIIRCSTETDLFPKGIRTIINPTDPESFIILINFNSPGLSKRHDKSSQSNPSRSVHMDMFFILDIFVIDRISPYSLSIMTGFEESHEIVLKLTREFSDCLSCLWADNHHLSHMRFGSGMRLKFSIIVNVLPAVTYLETILISTLLLTYLTVPPQTPKTYCQLYFSMKTVAYLLP